MAAFAKGAAQTDVEIGDIGVGVGAGGLKTF